MFEWALRESDSGWWPTTCGNAICSASDELGLGDNDAGSKIGSSSRDDTFCHDPETGRVVTNHLPRHQHGQPRPQQLLRRPTNPARIATSITRTLESFDDLCDSLHGNKLTLTQPQQQPQQQQQQQQMDAPPPGKRDSVLTVLTDASVTDSDSSGRDEAAAKNANAFRRRRHRARWVWALALFGVVTVLGVGIGIGMSSASKNSNDAINAESAAVGSEGPLSNDDNDESAAVGSEGPLSNDENVGSPSPEEGSDKDDGFSLTSAPGSTSTSPPILDADLDEFLNDPGNDGYNYTVNSDYLVGVYYYPWHGDNFHNGGGYLRNQLTPPQQPALGEYDDSRPEVIKQHMHWSRKANIGLWVTSWWGPNRVEDTNTKDVILPHEDIGNLKIALHYETTGRIESIDMSNVHSDIQYMCENYFDHPNYYRIDGRPVLVIYVTRQLHTDGFLEEALLTMRSEASKCGHSIYLIGDQVFSSAPNPDEPFVPFWYFDAVTNYDVYGSSGQPNGHAGAELVDSYYLEQEKWRQQALEENCRYIPPVSPGYNDRAVRLESDHPPLSRQLTADAEEGSLFWYQLKKALPLVDPLVDNLILVNSFNEWHEDTQIEPCIGEPASEPVLLTGGLAYVGYGELYLDILAAATSRGQDSTVFDYLFGGV